MVNRNEIGGNLSEKCYNHICKCQPNTVFRQSLSSPSIAKKSYFVLM